MKEIKLTCNIYRYECLILRDSATIQIEKHCVLRDCCGLGTGFIVFDVSKAVRFQLE